MTNDTSTIAGALQEVIDRLESNLQAKGVNAEYSSSTGILGLVDQISNISQSSGGSGGVPCYHVEFTNHSLSYGDWDFTNDRQVAYLEVYLQYQYAPYQGTVTISDGTNDYNVTTNTNGIGVLLAPITANSTTFTASYTNTSDTITVTKSTFLFKDSCTSSSNLSNYDSSVPIYQGSQTANVPSCAIEYDSTENTYKIYATQTSTSYYAMIPITPLNNQTNYVASMEIKSSKSYSSNEIGFYVDNSVDTTSYGYGTTMCVYYNRLYGKRCILTGVSTSNNLTLPTTTLAINTWYRIELEVTDTRLETKLYSIDGDLLGDFGYSMAINNKQLGIFQKMASVANSTNYIRNIKVRSIA